MENIQKCFSSLLILNLIDLLVVAPLFDNQFLSATLGQDLPILELRLMSHPSLDMTPANPALPPKTQRQ
jgi:hypothetical protein